MLDKLPQADIMQCFGETKALSRLNARKVLTSLVVAMLVDRGRLVSFTPMLPSRGIHKSKGLICTHLRYALFYLLLYVRRGTCQTIATLCIRLCTCMTSTYQVQRTHTGQISSPEGHFLPRMLDASLFSPNISVSRTLPMTTQH